MAGELIFGELNLKLHQNPAFLDTICTLTLANNGADL